MPLTFRPEPGTIVICDYAGFRPPEMVKVRPVVVLSPRRRVGQLVTVVWRTIYLPFPLHGLRAAPGLQDPFGGRT